MIWKKDQRLILETDVSMCDQNLYNKLTLKFEYQYNKKEVFSKKIHENYLKDHCNAR